MSVTQRRMIGEDLFRELLALLRQNEHVALLGPRHGAKALVLEKLQERSQTPELPAHEHPCILRLIWDRFETCNEEEFLVELHRHLAQTLQISVPRGPSIGRLSGRILDILLAAIAQIPKPRPLWIFIQDIIGFPKPIARQLLEAIRAAYYDETLRYRTAVVVTGSADFVHLTYGPNSPFNHARHILVGPMDRAFARSYFCERRAYNFHTTCPGIQCPDACMEITDDAFDYLYEQTGGSAHLIQELIVAVMRHPFNSIRIPMSRPWTLEQTRQHIHLYRETFMPYDHLLRMTVREIEAEPEAFDLLLAVLQQSEAIIPPPAVHEPCRLEVCGFVRLHGDRLRIASPMLRDFLLRVLTPRHIGDVLASQGRWEEAWARYRGVPRGRYERSIAGHARFRLVQVLLDWQAHLLNEAHQGVESVVRHFLNGARHLLGFDSGGLYDPESGQWLVLGSGTSPVDLPAPHSPVPPPADAPTLYYQGVRYHFDPLRLKIWSDPGFKSRLPGIPRPALQLAREGDGREIDMGDRRLVLEALDQFWKAYRAAQEFEYYQKIGALRERHLRVIEAINREMLTEPFDMGKVVRKTAEALVHDARYYRVLICLVEARGERIQSVASACADPEQDFDQPLDVLLTDTDVQAWVCREKRPVVVNNPTQPLLDFTVDPAFARRIGAHPFTIVPILDEERIVGTLQVERPDRQPPDPEELELYQIFAGQIAALFRQAQRLALLQGALDALGDRISILAPNNRLLFLNKAAARYLQREPGWLQHRDTPDWEIYQWAQNPPGPELLEQAPSDVPLHRYLTSDPAHPPLRAGDWQLARITDFRGHLPDRFRANPTIGFVERFQDLTELYTLLNALQNWLQASHVVEEIGQSLLDIFQQRGHAWARLYLCNYKTYPAGESTLESLCEYGLHDPERKRLFATGQVRHIPEKNRLPWHAIRVARQPAIYERDDRLPVDVILPVPSQDGFPHYRTGPLPDDPELERENVRVWIEAPLLVGERAVGLLSLAYPAESLRSEQWELLGLLVQGAALALDHAIQAERIRKLAMDAAKAELASLIFHDLRTALTICRGFVAAHQKAAREGRLTRELSIEWVNKLGMQLERLEKISSQYTRHVRGYSPDIQSGDLVPRLREVAQLTTETRPGLECHFYSAVDTLPVRTDINAIVRAIDELAYNAAKAGATRMALHLTDPGATDLIQLLVEDNGPGIPETVRPRLFVPDVRKSKGGTGLGLAIVRDTITALKGQIELQESRPGKTVFRIRLPRFYAE